MTRTSGAFGEGVLRPAARAYLWRNRRRKSVRVSDRGRNARMCADLEACGWLWLESWGGGVTWYRVLAVPTPAPTGGQCAHEGALAIEGVTEWGDQPRLQLMGEVSAWCPTCGAVELPGRWLLPDAGDKAPTPPAAEGAARTVEYKVGDRVRAAVSPNVLGVVTAATVGLTPGSPVHIRVKWEHPYGTVWVFGDAIAPDPGAPTDPRPRK